MAKSSTVMDKAVGRESNRPIWKGIISFGLVSVPVAGYTGARPERVSFNQLCPEHKCRVRQQLVCEEDGTVLQRDQLLKGYEYSKNSYVVVNQDELEQITPKSGSEIKVLRFVPQDQIDPIWLESSYFLKVDKDSKGNKIGLDGFALLRAAMQKRGAVAIGKMTRLQREHIIVLRPVGSGGLVMHTIFYADEVRRVTEDELPEVQPELLAVADQLIDALSGEFNPLEFEDEYRLNLEKLLQSKIEGKPIEAPQAEVAPKPPVDLMAAIKASLGAVKEAA